MDDISSHKKELRRKFKYIRSNITIEYREHADQLLSDKFLDLLKHTKQNVTLAAYWPIDSELNIIPLLSRLYKMGVTCALPKISDDKMSFVKWVPGLSTKINRYGIYEPSVGETITPNFMIIPHLACDKKGNRLGYGKGYYDKYLSASSSHIYVIALCYNQLLSKEELPHTNMDIKLDMVITEFDSFTIRPLS